MHENMRYRMQENGFWKVSWTHIQERSSDSRVKHKKKIINVAGFDSVTMSWKTTTSDDDELFLWYGWPTKDV